MIWLFVTILVLSIISVIVLSLLNIIPDFTGLGVKWGVYRKPIIADKIKDSPTLLIDTSKTYKLIDNDSNGYLTADGVNPLVSYSIQLKTPYKPMAQFKWRFIPVKDDIFRVMNVWDGKCLMANAGKVVTGACDTVSEQYDWVIEKSGEVYIIRNRANSELSLLGQYVSNWRLESA